MISNEKFTPTSNFSRWKILFHERTNSINASSGHFYLALEVEEIAGATALIHSSVLISIHWLKFSLMITGVSYLFIDSRQSSCYTKINDLITQRPISRLKISTGYNRRNCVKMAISQTKLITDGILEYITDKTYSHQIYCSISWLYNVAS
jgi:hypothetical protein